MAEEHTRAAVDSGEFAAHGSERRSTHTGPSRKVTVMMERGAVDEVVNGDADTATALEVPARRRKPIILALRIALSALMLLVLWGRMPNFRLDHLLPEWSRETAMFLALATIFTLAGIVLSTLRWRAVLNALGQDAELRPL